MKWRLRREAAPERLVSSGFLVPAYYAAQTRARFDEPWAAAAHYLDSGWSLGLLPNPVHDFDGRTLPGPDQTSGDDFPAYTALLPVRRHFDIGSYARLAPQSCQHPGGAAADFLERVGRGTLPFGLATPTGVRSWSGFLELTAQRGKELAAITRSGEFDRELYEAQVGFAFASVEAAVWHYIERGEAAGLLPHPGFHSGMRQLPPDPDHNRFARAIRLKSFADRSASGSDERRQDVLRLVRAARTSWDLAQPSGIPTPEESARLARERPVERSDERVTVVARGSSMTLAGSHQVGTLLAQTHQGWDLIIGLDPDADWRVRARVSRVAAMDQRIQVVEVPDDVGTAPLLAELAPGELAAVWDGTEQWAPRFLELAISAAEGHTAGIVASAHGTELASLDPHARHDGRIDSVDHLVWSGPRSLRGAVVNKTILDHVPDAFGLLGGWEALLHARSAGPVGYVPIIGVVGDQHETPPRGHVAAVRSRWVPSAPVARTTHLISAVLPTVHDTSAAAATIGSAVDLGLEVVVAVDDQIRMLDLVARLEDVRGVDVCPLPAHTTWGHSAAVAVSHARGDSCLFMAEGAPISGPALEALRSALTVDVAAASAVTIAADSTIAGITLVFPGRHALPHRLLAGHPVEDVPNISDIDLTAADAEGLLIRTSLLDDLRLDPSLDEAWAMPDLTLRMTDAGHALRAAPRALIARQVVKEVAHETTPPPARLRRLQPGPDETALLRSVGLERWKTSSRPDDIDQPLLKRPVRTVETVSGQRLPSLRWAIKAPMLPGPRGDNWGDTFFIDDLARSLRGLGQEVVVDRRLSHHRSQSSHLDDVVLNVRGLSAYRPQPGTTSLLWIISHPELIEPVELDESIDVAYAASESWAARATLTFGRTVHPLLQATDPTRFHPDVVPDPHGVVFVGRPRRGQPRPIVRDALSAGASLEVYGEHWAGLIPPDHHRAEFISNDLLPQVYGGARVVLNDHHAEMARHGFWSNRTFDAVAAGATVVSDHVEGGVPELFGGMVRTYTSVDDLRELLSSDLVWPDRAERLEIARRVGREHSFDARARRMLADVLDVRGIDHDLST